MKLFRLNPSLNHPNRKDFARNNAIAMWRAKDFLDWSADLPDITGNGHDARFGSTDGVDTNDPLFLPFDGEQYLYFPGTGGDTLDINDVGFGEGTGYRFEFEIERLTDEAGWGRLMAHGWGDRYLVYLINSSGLFNLYCGLSSGHSAISVQSPIGNGQGRYKIALELHVYDNYIYGYCYEWVNGSWQLYHQNSRNVTTETFNVGPRSDAQFRYHRTGVSPREHILYNFKYYNLDENRTVADLAAAFDANTSEEPHMQVEHMGFTSVIGRPASGRKPVLVDRPLLLFGTDDYLEVPKSSDIDFSSGDFSAVAIFRVHHFPASGQHTYIGDYTTQGGWLLYSTTSVKRFWVRNTEGGSSQNIGSAQNFNSTSIFAGTREGAQFTAYLNGIEEETVTNSNISNISTANELRMGSRPNNTQFADMEFIGAAIFKNKVLTELELHTVAKEIIDGDRIYASWIGTHPDTKYYPSNGRYPS